MYMPKFNIKRYVIRKLYHEIFSQIYDIMIWNDSGKKEKYTPLDHVCRCIGINHYYMLSFTKETINYCLLKPNKINILYLQE